MYHQFNVKQFYILPAQCIYVFCVDPRTLFPYTTLSDWFLYPKYSVYCAVRTGSLNIIQVNISLQSRSLPNAVSRRPLNAEARVRSQIS